MFNKIIDFLAFVISKLSVLLIILVLGLIIFSRMDKLFNMNIMQDRIAFSDNEKNTENTDENKGKAKIIYEGNIKPSDEIRSEVSTDAEGNVLEEVVTFEILEEQDAEQVAEVLKNYNLIQDSATFISLLERANLIDGIKPGVYKVPSNIKNMDLIETITIIASRSELDSRISGEEKPVEIVTFEIKEEDNLDKVAELLKSNELIQDKATFKILLKEAELTDSIMPGVYKVPANIKNADLIEYITTEDLENENVTNGDLELEESDDEENKIEN